jgi:hypothetical protein
MKNEILMNHHFFPDDREQFMYDLAGRDQRQNTRVFILIETILQSVDITSVLLLLSVIFNTFAGRF